MAQKDTRHFESLLKVRWLKGMAKERIIVIWKRAISSHDALQLAKKQSQTPALERM